MFRIVREAIEPHALVARCDDGALATFSGIVRDRADDGRRVSGLWYEAFEPMAVREFETIANEARERFGEVRIAIIHRVGELKVGEVSVLVVAAAAHRGTAFDACRYAIDQLKVRAPIWKRERYADGGVQWKASVEQG
ncbi:MAG: molybdenum cofactor biosynthesis protein MoaE [Candidatus Eremiobacteraeota bacterium]|nr:molybdenum cofactor biosynthesis protein MoaE [Candidatus Eremiobacteraeota bacterium]